MVFITIIIIIIIIITVVIVILELSIEELFGKYQVALGSHYKNNGLLKP